jgi:adenylate cyclase
MIFEDLGEQLVKNIAHPIRAFRLRTGEVTSQQEVSTPEETAEAPERPSAPAEISELSADHEVALELALWDSVKEVSGGHLRLARPNPT